MALFSLVFDRNQLTMRYLRQISNSISFECCNIRKFSKMFPDAELDLCYDYVLELTKKAGDLVKEKLNAPRTTEVKSSNIDLVTETDKAVEELLINNLHEKFPSHKFIGEESVAAGEKCQLTSDPTWIIDPIDGTMNFVHGFPHCCISIALFVNESPMIGIIYNPNVEQLFTARKGQGAFLNGKRIQVSHETELSRALLMVEMGTSRDAEKYEVVFENQKTLIPAVHGTRSLGSAALNMAMVALGAADVYFEFGIHVWDIAAGELIVKEAGGVVIDPSGGEIDRFSRRMLCASSQNLANQIVKSIKQYYPKPRDD